MKAVDAWRGNAPAGAATQSQAEKLAQELELEREAMSLRIKKQREEAERRLQEVCGLFLKQHRNFLLCLVCVPRNLSSMGH